MRAMEYGMRNFETLYQILGDTRDLLRGGRRSVVPSFADRVQNLMQTMDGDERSAERSESASESIIEERRQKLAVLNAGIAECARCALSIGRTHAVAGEGVLDPLVMFIGEGPGRDEDVSGRPFVGAAGRFLDRWLQSIGLDRNTNAYITNIVKCRPPNNRDPQPEESDACALWLHEQIVLVRPRMIVTLGRISMRVLTGTTQGITRIHGTFYSWRGIPLVPTFHPSAVLRRDEWKRPVWEDLKTVRNWLVDNAGHVVPENSPE